MARLSTRLRRLIVVNLLTFSRLLAGLGSVFVLLLPHGHLYLLALYIYIFSSDVLDGTLARRWRVTTAAGSIFDYVVDRFNLYLQIAVLISLGVPVWVFIIYLFRDLMYIFTQSYVKLDRVAGTKALSLVSTVATYWYVLWHAFGNSGATLLNVCLALTYILSCLNLAWRIFRLRQDIVENVRREFSI